MNVGQILIENKILSELMDVTESKTPLEAMDKAIRFTLLHDVNSIRDALFELATKHA